MDFPSPFASRLGTNYSPTKEEMIRINDFLTSPISTLETMQDRIDSAQAQLDSLRVEHGTLLQHIDNHRALLTPMRRLPTDILQEILLHCLPQTHNAVISRLEYPILATQVCSAWRHVALRTPRLWASIHIPIPSDVTTINTYRISSYSGSLSSMLIEHRRSSSSLDEVAQRRAQAITEWLQRSGACILNITLYDGELNTPSHIYRTILTALLPFSGRFGTLVCDTPASHLGQIVTLPSSAVPELHTLHIRGKQFGHQPPPYPDFWANSGVVQAQKLRNITYTNITEDFTLKFRANWAQLTSISLHDLAHAGVSSMTVARVSKLLSCCPLLRYFCVEMSPRNHDQLWGPYSATPDPTDIPGSIVLPHLTHLLVHANYTDVEKLFEALEVPVLQNLEFSASASASSPLFRLINRTKHVLRKLKLNPYGFFTREEFFQCMQSCPNITHLIFGRYPSHRQRAASNTESAELVELDNSFLQRLLSVPPDEVLLPRLTNFSCQTIPKFSDIFLLEMLSQRNIAAAADNARSSNSLAKIKKVDVCFDFFQQQCAIDKLRSISESGVACQLTYPSSHGPTLGAKDGISSASGFVTF